MGYGDWTRRLSVPDFGASYVSKPQKRKECYGAQLTFEQMYELQVLIEETDFEAPTLATRNRYFDDWANYSLSVNDGSTSVKFDTQFLQSPWAVPHHDLSSAWKLWSAIDDLSPYGLRSDEESEPEQGSA